MPSAGSLHFPPDPVVKGQSARLSYTIGYLLWMDEALHHLRKSEMRHDGCFASTNNQWFQSMVSIGFPWLQSGAGFCPSPWPRDPGLACEEGLAFSVFSVPRIISRIWKNRVIIETVGSPYFDTCPPLAMDKANIFERNARLATDPRSQPLYWGVRRLSGGACSAKEAEKSC